MSSEAAAALVQFIRTLEFPEREAPPRKTYGHIGATLADSILQAGLNYRAVVEPRISRIRARFPEAQTISGLSYLIEYISVHDFLDWKHPVKPSRFLRLLDLLTCHCIETESELSDWLTIERHCELLSTIHGIGPKTVDYLKILVGHDAVAVDRHIRTFVRDAGIFLEKYEDVRFVVCEAADLLSMSSSSLDALIWMHSAARANVRHAV